MSIEMQLAGFLFYWIIFTNVASVWFGLETYSNLDSTAKLQKINKDPKKFKIGLIFILLEHVSIIALAIMLFIAFSSYNIILGIVWVSFRISEGLLQIYYKKDYWQLLHIAEQYAVARGVEQNALIEFGRSILKTKNASFAFAQILFSIGTLAYSILFVTIEEVPAFFGWFGIVASILWGVGNAVLLVKPDFELLSNVGGLLVLIFEIVLGGWLLLV
ncbi:MAG: DUF4386 domain-containing protein [Candidatus Heimdallarchaeota archaeon]